MKENVYDRYTMYVRRCQQINVLPASFGLWQEIEPWLIAHGRICVLEELRADWLEREMEFA